jgi:ubiquinone/menaquinone biosynthesis C-methylase UbiE
MADASSAPHPTLDRIMDGLIAYQESAALKGAIDLDLFSAIAEGALTAEALAERCGASERGTRILANYLTVQGYLTKEGGRYGLTPDTAAFLDRRSPMYIGGASGFLTSKHLISEFRDVAAIVRKGGALDDMNGLEPEHPMWVDFARSMMPLMMMPAQRMAEALGADAGEPWKVLDIAAGHGIFGIVIAQRNPNARVVAVDWTNVLEFARQNAHGFDVADRYDTLPGSAFEVDFEGDYDIVLLPNFLHHFDAPTCEQLLKKVHAALADGGRAVTLEFIPNEDRVSPPIPATFAMMMLGTTPSGDAYTFSELERMFTHAGFSRNELHPLPPSPEQVIISYK